MTPEIPKFSSDEEEAEFWDTHSALEFLDGSEAVELDVSEARKKREQRQTKAISLRISRTVLEGTKSRAAALHVPYQTLIQLWIAERLEKEEATLKSYSDAGGRARKPSPRRGRTTPAQ